MSKLEKMRDELAKKHSDEYCRVWQGFEKQAFDSGFAIGFDAADAHYRPIVENLIKALEFECGNRCAVGINPCNARETLESVRSKI